MGPYQTIGNELTLLSEGGYPKFVTQGFNDKYLPVWLQQAGYNTYYTGKLFNVLTVDNYDDPVPGGFTGSVCQTLSYMIRNGTNLARTSCLILSRTTT